MMTDTCETCGAEAVGFGEQIAGLPNRRRACREHADKNIVYQASYGYTDRDEAETHVRESIMEARDALVELAEFDGFRRELYYELARALGSAHDLLLEAPAL